MQKHKEIKKFELYKDGGLVIKFKDGDHTFIDPENMKTLLKNIKLRTNLLKDE